MMQMKLSRQCDLQGVVVVHRSCQEVFAVLLKNHWVFCVFLRCFASLSAARSLLGSLHLLRLFLKLDLAPISYYVAGKTPFVKVSSLDPVEPTRRAYQRDGQENAFHSELNASHTFLQLATLLGV